MAGTFVPFFEKHAADDALPEYQFTQYRPDRAELPPPAPEFQPPGPEIVEPEAVTDQEERPPAPQKVQRIDRSELKAKLQSDLRNAIALSLPEESIRQITNELAKLRPPPSSSPDQSLESDNAASAEPGDAADKTNITLEKDGDKVTNITVECDCGQVIELDCVY